MKNVLTHEDLVAYLEEDDGWVIGKSRKPFSYIYYKDLGSTNATRKREDIDLKSAVNDEKGVFLRWFKCTRTRDQKKQQYAYFSRNCGHCADVPHIHLEVRIKTQSGGLANKQPLFTPSCLSIVRNARGCPKHKILTVDSDLPQPFFFNTNDYMRDDADRWTRVSQVRSCILVGAVGLSDNHKAIPGLAQRPDQEVWFHFDCLSPMGASFDIITDGECFHPLSRRSMRISGKMQPKKSVDLNLLGTSDQEMFVKIIEDYASNVSDNGTSEFSSRV